MNVKPAPLLPRDTIKDNPLFVVLAILAFLATLSLLSFKASYVSMAHWRAGLSETASVQIKSSPENQVEHARIALEIVQKSPAVSSAHIISNAEAKALLRPWLGEVELPDELPLPTLLDIGLKTGQTLNVPELQTQFIQMGIAADIDDHSYWTQALSAKARAVQIVSLFALFLIAIAVFSACIFAVRAGVTGQKKLMNILQNIGTAPNYTARIFSQKFSLTSFKSGLIGAGCGFLLLWILSSVFASPSADTVFSGFRIGINDLYLSAIIPVSMGVISGLTTWHSIVKSLYGDIYS